MRCSRCFGVNVQTWAVLRGCTIDVFVELMRGRWHVLSLSLRRHFSTFIRRIPDVTDVRHPFTHPSRYYFLGDTTVGGLENNESFYRVNCMVVIYNLIVKNIPHPHPILKRESRALLYGTHVFYHKFINTWMEGSGGAPPPAGGFGGGTPN